MIRIVKSKQFEFNPDFRVSDLESQETVQIEGKPFLIEDLNKAAATDTLIKIDGSNYSVEIQAGTYILDEDTIDEPKEFRVRVP